MIRLSCQKTYNMDETGNLLSNLTTRKYVLHAADTRQYRGATVKRQLVKSVGKQHFTLLYDQGRRAVLTPSNIKSAWAKVDLYPFDPDRVLRDIQKPLAAVSPSSPTVDMA
jgi:hypothetical protein